MAFGQGSCVPVHIYASTSHSSRYAYHCATLSRSDGRNHRRTAIDVPWEECDGRNRRAAIDVPWEEATTSHGAGHSRLEGADV